VARAFQQFSRFSLGKELIQITQHHLLQKHEISKRGKVLESLAFKLGQPGKRLRKAEETIRHIQFVFGLFSGTGDIQRPCTGNSSLTRLDEFGDGDVDDALAAGLRTRDAEQAVDLAASTLTCGAREFVAEANCYSPL
jgi:hypothetical protein